LILSGSEDSTVKLWELESGKEIRYFEGHKEGVGSVCFSPNGRNALSRSFDYPIKIWEIESGKEILSIEGPRTILRSVCFSPDGQEVIIGCEDGAIRVFNILTKKQIHVINVKSDGSSAFCFSVDGRFALATIGVEQIGLWDIRNGQKIRMFKGSTGVICSVGFSPDDQYAVSGNSDETIKLWDFKKGQLIQTFEGIGYFAHFNCFSLDIFYAFSRKGDRIRLLKLPILEEIRSFNVPIGTISCICFSPDSQYALIGGVKNDLKILDTQSGNEIWSYEVFKDGGVDDVCCVSISPSGQYAMSGNMGGLIKLWNFANGEAIRSFEGHSFWVLAVCMSPDGQFVLSGARDQTIKIWNTQTGNEHRSINLTHKGDVSAISFSPNCKHAVTGSYDGTLKYWDLKNGQEIHAFSGHGLAVSSVCISKDDRFTLSGSWDRTLKLWDNIEGKEIATLISLDSDDWIITSPSGLFDASEGALTKIHYTIGLETIGFDQLIGTYHIPRLLSLLLNDKEDVPDVPPIENIRLHPSIDARIENNTLILELENRGGGIGKVLVYAGEMEIIEDARLKPLKDRSKERLTIQIDLKNYHRFFIYGIQNLLTVFIENGNGTLRSKPHQLFFYPEYLVSKGGINTNPEVEAMAEDSPNPIKLHGIFIGSNTYGLEWAGSDAEAMADIVLSSGKKLYGDHVETSVFSGENFSKDEVLKQFGHMSEYLTSEDIVVIFLSGHAATDGKFQEYYFLLKENKTVESMGKILENPSMRKKCTLSLTELRRAVNKIPARKKILILDTCSSGHVADHFGRIKSADVEIYSQEKILKEVRSSTGFCILSSCAKDQKDSYEKGRFKHGLMTYSILNGISTGDGLLKKSDNREYIEPVTLFNYVKVKTEKLASSANQSQVPNIYMPKSLDLLIGEVSEEEKKSIQISLLPLFTWSSIVSSEYNDVLDIEKKTDQVLKRSADLNHLEFTNRKDQPDVNQIMGTYRIEAETLIIQCWIKKGGQTVEGSKSDMIVPLDEVEKAAFEIVQVLRNFVNNH